MNFLDSASLKSTGLSHFKWPIHDITSSDTSDLDNVGSPSYAGLLNVDTFCSVVSKKNLIC